MWITHLLGLAVWLVLVVAEGRGLEPPHHYYLHETGGRYRFGYKTADQMAEAEGDPSSEVKGRFAYVDNNGDKQGVEYTAGVHGYVPKMMSEQEAESSMLVPTIVQPNDEGTGPTDANIKTRRYQTNRGTLYKKRGREIEEISDTDKKEENIGNKEKMSEKLNKTPNTEDTIVIGEKKEKSSEKDTVRGKYTYIEEDGLPATIEYEAGPEIGFIVKGFTKESLQSRLIAKGSDATYDKDGLGLRSEQHPPNYTEEGTEETYPEGLVKGLYTFTDEDGVPATVEYEAGPKIGFVVKKFSKGKEELDQQDSGSGTTFNKNSVVVPSIFHEEPSEIRLSSANESLEIQAEKLSSNIKVNTSFNQEQNQDDDFVEANSEPSYTHEKISGFKDEAIEQPDEDEKQFPMNAAYRFGFSVHDQSRHEEADSSGDVRGNYSYVDGAGLLTKVEYEAGAKKGFVIKRMTHERKQKPSFKIGDKKQTLQLNDENATTENTAGSQRKDKYGTNSFENKEENLDEIIKDGSEVSQYASREYEDERNLPIKHEHIKNNRRAHIKDSNIASESMRHLSFAYPNAMVVSEGLNKNTLSKQNRVQFPAILTNSDPENKYYEVYAGLNPSLYSLYFKNPNYKQEAEAIRSDGGNYFKDSAKATGNNHPYLNTYNQNEETQRVASNLGFSVYGLPLVDQPEIPFVVNSNNTRKTEVHKGKHHHKRKKVVKRPMQTPPNNVTNVHTPDGSYAFAYKTKDHSREQSVDQQGNVHYRYQINTKRDGNTLVIFSTQVPKKLTTSNDKDLIKEESDNYPDTDSNVFLRDPVNKPYYDISEMYSSDNYKPLIQENKRRVIVRKRFTRRQV